MVNNTVLDYVPNVKTYIDTITELLEGYGHQLLYGDTIQKVSIDVHFAPQSLDELHYDIFPMIKQSAQWIGFLAERVSTGEALDRGIVERGGVNDLLYEIAIVWGGSAGVYATSYILHSTQPVVVKLMCQPCLWDVEHDCRAEPSMKSWLGHGAVESIQDRGLCDWDEDVMISAFDAQVFTTMEGVSKAHRIVSQSEHWSSDIVFHVMPVAAVGLWDERRHQMLDQSDPLEYMPFLK